MSVDLKPLHRGKHGELHRQFQAALNRRLRSRGLEALCVKEDGVTGAKTLEAARKAAWALGALSDTYDAITKTSVIPVGVQRMVRNPGRRTTAQQARAKKRMAQMRAQRKRRAAAAKHEHEKTGGSSRTKAVNAFLAKVGTVEHPPGSNGGGIISVMEAYWGFGRVAWCGISAGYHAKKFGGVDELRSDVASVAAIENHAKAGHAPYGHWTGDVRSVLPGSLVVIGGYGVHVCMKVDDHPVPSMGIKTVEGNTSFSNAGSQSNGGCIAARVRGPAVTRGSAAMNYPG